MSLYLAVPGSGGRFEVAIVCGTSNTTIEPEMTLSRPPVDMALLVLQPNIVPLTHAFKVLTLGGLRVPPITPPEIGLFSLSLCGSAVKTCQRD